jgi:hypothetical protein
MFGIIVPFQMSFYVVLLTLVGFLKLWLFHNSLDIPTLTNNKMYFQSKIGWKVHKQEKSHHNWSLYYIYWHGFLMCVGERCNDQS